MRWSLGAQRVLLVLAAALLTLGAVLGGQAARRPAAVAVGDDPSLDVRLDLNRATPADLETLPGVGTTLAGKIDAYRAAHGPFRTVDELGRVPGVGRKLAASLRAYVVVR